MILTYYVLSIVPNILFHRSGDHSSSCVPPAVTSIRKDIIGNPQEGEILTETWSNAFRRVGLLGRLGFTRTYIDIFILKVFGNSMWDYAPDNPGEFGLDYIIQY